MTKIRAYRILMGMSQDEFCKLFDLSRSTLSYWERGKCDPPPILFRLLQKAYPVSKEALDAQMQVPNHARVKRAEPEELKRIRMRFKQ